MTSSSSKFRAIQTLLSTVPDLMQPISDIVASLLTRARCCDAPSCPDINAAPEAVQYVPEHTVIVYWYLRLRAKMNCQDSLGAGASKLVSSVGCLMPNVRWMSVSSIYLLRQGIWVSNCQHLMTVFRAVTVFFFVFLTKSGITSC